MMQVALHHSYQGSVPLCMQCLQSQLAGPARSSSPEGTGIQHTVVFFETRASSAFLSGNEPMSTSSNSKFTLTFIACEIWLTTHVQIYSIPEATRAIVYIVMLAVQWKLLKMWTNEYFAFLITLWRVIVLCYALLPIYHSWESWRTTRHGHTPLEQCAVQNDSVHMLAWYHLF